MTSQKTNGLVSAPTDQVLTNSETNQKKAEVIMPLIINPEGFKAIAKLLLDTGVLLMAKQKGLWS